MSLRARLIWLVLALALPLVSIGVAGLYQTYASQTAAQREIIQETARALSLAVDREIGKAEVALEILSRSVFLAREDLEGFHARAQEMVPWPDTSIVLFTPEGNELLSTVVPFGTPTLRSPRAEAIQRVATSRKAEISGVFTALRTKRSVLALMVPVIVEGRVRYVLTMALSASIFQSLVSSLQLPASWFATITDADGKVVARSQELERFIGQAANEEFRALIRRTGSGSISTISMAGAPVIATFNRSPEYGLVGAVSYPEDALNARVRESLGWGVALLIVASAGIVVALFLVRDILGPLGGLLASAQALGRGRLTEPRRTGITEFDQLEVALADAARTREEAASKVRESELHLRLAIEAGELGAWSYEPRSGTFATSPLCKAKFGRAADEAFTYDDLLASIHPEDLAHQQDVVAGAMTRRESFQVEYRVIWPDASLHWVQVRGGPVGSDDAFRLIGVSQDITDRKTAEARQELLLGELNHRVKNTLATVQSLATMTRRTSPDTGTAWDTFDHRVRGMSKTHDLLTASQWEGASLRDILVGELDLYQDALKQRVSLRGPSVRVGARATLALGLAVHELATNAAKYGSLSVSEGRLAVQWTIAKVGGLPHLLIEWSESGGPPVKAPTRQGFGSRLLQRSIGLELGGDLKLRYEPTGLRCVMTFPLHSVEERIEAADTARTNVLPFAR